MSHSTPSSELRLFVGDLLRRPGSRRDLDAELRVPGLRSGLVAVDADEPVRCRVALESIAEGIVVHGRASVTWRAECARCLDPMTGETEVAVDELFESEPTPGDTYQLEPEEIDLDQMLRDVLVVEFPLAPAPPVAPDGRCTQCGRLPSDLVAEAPEPKVDHRWHALDALLLSPSDESTSQER